MKILLDESVDVRLRLHLPGHDVFSVGHMQWKGLTNGALLAQAASEHFDVLITTDRNIGHQQNQSALPCSVMIVHAGSSLRSISPLIPTILATLATLQPRTLVHVR